MKKYVNWQTFLRVFAVLTMIEACLLLSGCTAAWLTAVNAMLPSLLAVVNAVVAFVASLQGKTVSSATYAKIQQWQNNIATEIANAQSIIAAFQQSASTGLLTQFQAAMQAVLTNLNSILSGLDVTDSATVGKLTQLIGLGVAAVNAILALIPMAISKMESGASKEELAHYDKLGASATKTAEKTLKETYVAIVTEHTANDDVNKALDALPRTV